MEKISLTRQQYGYNIRAIMRDRCAVAIDLGGTWIRVALVHQSTGILRSVHCPTKNERSAEAIFGDIVALIAQVGNDSPAGISVVGIGVPTTFSAEGELDPCPNLPTMTRYPMKHKLSEAVGAEVCMENDATCFTLGEWHLRRQENPRSIAGVTLGTSIGLGFVLDGKPHRGATGQSGEIWRSPTCMELHEGHEGILDELLSGKALENRFAAISGTRESGEKIFAYAEQGDRAALATFHEYGVCLGRALCWVSDIVDPDLVVLGGAIAKAFSFIFPGIIANPSLKSRTILNSENTERSALYGAAVLAFQQTGGASS
jgi:predicted NBD/HSP70 family sugar kinase